jgi:CBS domain-containing protein
VDVADREESAVSIIHPDDPIRLLVSSSTASIEPTATLRELAVKLERECVGALVVMPDESVSGVVSERDVVRAVAVGGELDEVWAADVMTEEPVRVDLDETIADAAERMLAEAVRHLPVVDGARLVGVVSIRDVLQVFVDEWRRAAE